MVHLRKQKCLLNHFCDIHNNKTDAEQIEKEIVLVLAQTDFDTASSLRVFPKYDSSTTYGSFS